MTVGVKLTGALYDEICRDLRRRHPFAAERVGFVFGRVGTGADGRRLVLLTRYQTIPDEQYLDDPSVGACIGPDAMTAAMQAVYRGRPRHEGIFHIHLHDHHGETGMSPIDRRGIPPMIPGFRRAGRDAPHGFIILSADHGSAWVLLQKDTDLVEATEIAVVGAPLKVFRKGTSR
jgi:hypothetical protein